MTSTIDSAGRLVIPKAIRDSLGLTGGYPVLIRERDGIIEIEPAPSLMHLEDRGHGLVAVPDDSLPTLSPETVRETLESTRR